METGFRFSFYTGTFFEPYMFPVFVVEVAFFGWSSVEVVDEVSNPVFDGGAFGIHVHVWGEFKLNQLVNFIRYIFEASDRIEVFGPVAEVSSGIEDEGEASSVFFDGIGIGMGSGVQNHLVGGDVSDLELDRFFLYFID